jgi:hypothetical protein
MNESEAPDAIDAAIEKTGAPKVMHMTAVLAKGGEVKITVPHPFGPDEFESCVGMLMQLRVASEQRAAEENPIITPSRPTLVAADGRRLT